MSLALIEFLKAEVAKLEAAIAPTVEVIEADADAMGKAVVAYIKANGLNDLLAIAKAVLLSVTAGTPWGAVLADVVAQGEAAGIQIAKGSEAVVVAMAQADLIAAGHLPVPAAAPVAASTPAA